MVITYYIKLFGLRAHKHNDILKSLNCKDKKDNRKLKYCGNEWKTLQAKM